MNQLRRTLLKGTGTAGTVAVAIAVGLLKPSQVLAAEWDRTAFGVKTMADAMRDIGAASAIASKDIRIDAPDIAENGAVVPVEITSNIPGTESIDIVVEKNVYPLAAIFRFSNGAEGTVSTRIKMVKSSPVRAVVKAGGKTYTAAKVVKVTIGGCGG